MATYKLIQDIEAEDHVLGPLSFRQFVFALISVFFGYMTFIVITKHVAVLALVFGPPALFFGFFALPFGKDQPTEIWALAVIRYFLKPRKRVWDQSGQKDLVTITVPKRVEKIYTDGLSQDEVKSRLNALASTLDSRGWAVKNTGEAQPAIVQNSDRLVGLSVESQDVPDIDIRASDDILDNTASPIAQQFTDMIDASTQAHRQQLMDKLNNIKADNNQRSVISNDQVGQNQDFSASVEMTGGGQASGQQLSAGSPQQAGGDWFMSDQSGQQSAISNNQNQDFSASVEMTGGGVELGQQQVVNGYQDVDRIAEIQAEAAQIVAGNNQQSNQQLAINNEQVGQNQDFSTSVEMTGGGVTPGQQPVASSYQTTASPDILSLAHNDDLNIATLARQADKKNNQSSDEVVISLH